MPLAVQKSSDQVAEWSCSTIVLGEIAENNDRFKIRRECVCVKLLGHEASGGSPNVISGAICRYLGDETKFQVRAKKYVLASESIDNARILLNSGWTPNELPALVCIVIYGPRTVTDQSIRAVTSSDPLWLPAKLCFQLSSWQRSRWIRSGSVGRTSWRLTTAAIQTIRSRFRGMIRSHKSTAPCLMRIPGMHKSADIPILKCQQE